jgi:hypothetical protein
VEVAARQRTGGDQRTRSDRGRTGQHGSGRANTSQDGSAFGDFLKKEKKRNLQKREFVKSVFYELFLLFFILSCNLHWLISYFLLFYFFDIFFGFLWFCLPSAGVSWGSLSAVFFVVCYDI